MQHVVCIKLCPDSTQVASLREAQVHFASICHFVAQVAQVAQAEKIKDQHELRKACYYAARQECGSKAQTTQLAIKQVAAAYKTLSKLGRLSANKPWPVLRYRADGACAYDARTYAVIKGGFSLLTPAGRIKVPCILGPRQRRLARLGTAQEARLVHKRGEWYLHVVLRRPNPARVASQDVLGVDVGELTLAATSSGRISKANRMKHDRDKVRGQRARLQRQGTQSAKQALCKVKGREARRTRHVNHVESRRLVQEAQSLGVGAMAMEDLTHIRECIRAGARMRARLHRWPWHQLQTFVAYKAEEVGIRAVFVNPAYTSQTCARCLCLGRRKRLFFSCSCGSRRHADANAALNIRRLALPIGSATPYVTAGNVALGAGRPLSVDHKSSSL